MFLTSFVIFIPLNPLIVFFMYHELRESSCIIQLSGPDNQQTTCVHVTSGLYITETFPFKVGYSDKLVTKCYKT